MAVSYQFHPGRSLQLGQIVQIEQAIFTSAKSDRASGYHLVSRSPGITEADARDLASWGPSHDSLLGSEAWPPQAEVTATIFSAR